MRYLLDTDHISVLQTDSILLTRNFADFEKVPGLRFEDWTAP